MTLPEIYDLCEYWADHPPVCELLSMLATCYTTWRPRSRPMTEAEHRASLEARWKSGAMNIADLYKCMGGAMSLDGSHGKKMTGRNLPGIGPFPDQATAAVN